jgi:small-conductance mechanosensitive channel
MTEPAKSPRNSTRQGRYLALLTGAAFTVSLVFPIAAGLVQNSAALPGWWGVADVVFAFILAALAITVAARFDRRRTPEIDRTSYRVFRFVVNLILVLLVIFLIGGDRIRWTIFLPGIAWRGWLFLYAFPAWLTALRSTSTGEMNVR